jgi:hypothetical protein
MTARGKGIIVILKTTHTGRETLIIFPAFFSSSHVSAVSHSHVLAFTSVSILLAILNLPSSILAPHVLTLSPPPPFSNPKFSNLNFSGPPIRPMRPIHRSHLQIRHRSRPPSSILKSSRSLSAILSGLALAEAEASERRTGAILPGHNRSRGTKDMVLPAKGPLPCVPHLCSVTFYRAISDIFGFYHALLLDKKMQLRQS